LKDDKALIHFLGNLIGQLPQIEKNLKTIVIGYLTIYQKLIIQEKNIVMLNKELLEAYKYIEKIEKENEFEVH